MFGWNHPIGKVINNCRSYIIQILTAHERNCAKHLPEVTGDCVGYYISRDEVEENIGSRSPVKELFGVILHNFPIKGHNWMLLAHRR